MTEYTLPNGDLIKVGELYKTRDGRKAFIHHQDDRCKFYIVVKGDDKLYVCDKNGQSLFSEFALVSLWPSEPVTKCNQLGKIEVTDELEKIAHEVYYNNNITHYTRMHSALEAVFTHIAQEPKEENKSCECALPTHEYGVGESWKGKCDYTRRKEEKKEPKKQTLLEFACTKYRKNNTWRFLTPNDIICLISEYLQTQGIGRD